MEDNILYSFVENTIINSEWASLFYLSWLNYGYLEQNYISGNEFLLEYNNDNITISNLWSEEDISFTLSRKELIEIIEANNIIKR